MTTRTRIPLRHHTARLVSVALLGGAALLGPALAPPATAGRAGRPARMASTRPRSASPQTGWMASTCPPASSASGSS